MITQQWTQTLYLDSPCRELSSGGLGITANLLICWGIEFSCVFIGGPISNPAVINFTSTSLTYHDSKSSPISRQCRIFHMYSPAWAQSPAGRTYLPTKKTLPTRKSGAGQGMCQLRRLLYTKMRVSDGRAPVLCRRRCIRGRDGHSR